MEDVTTLAALAALAFKVTSLAKFIVAGQFRQAITTLIPWAAAFGVLLLGAQADATAAMVLPGFSQTLGHLDVASLFLAATALGSTASVVYDFKSAIDNHDTAVEPPLGGPPVA